MHCKSVGEKEAYFMCTSNEHRYVQPPTDEKALKGNQQILQCPNNPCCGEEISVRGLWLWGHG